MFATPDGVEVVLADGEEGVAPGQACVIYDSADDHARLLGGGTIKASVRETAAFDAARTAPATVSA